MFMQGKLSPENWGEGTLATEHGNTNIESGILTDEETIIRHVRKKGRIFPLLDSLKTTDSTKLTPDYGTSRSQGKNDMQASVGGSSEIDVVKLLSPSAQKRQLCSLAMAGDNSFLGFQSVFSFL